MKNGNREESLLISGIDSSTIHQQLDFSSKDSYADSRLDFSESQEDFAIKVQESFSISEIYREAGKENLFPAKSNETSDFFNLLQDNSGIHHPQNTCSGLDQSSIISQVPKPLYQVINKTTEQIIKKQQKKYYKAFIVLQAHFLSAKQTAEIKIQNLNSQIKEANSSIQDNKDFISRLESGVEQRMETIKEEALQKFKLEAGRLMQNFQNRENDLKQVTKNTILKIRKEVDGKTEPALRSFDRSRAKNSEDLLRKDCEMRLKLALVPGNGIRTCN